MQANEPEAQRSRASWHHSGLGQAAREQIPPGRPNSESRSALCSALSASGFPAEASPLERISGLRFLLSETFSILPRRDRGVQSQTQRARELTRPAAWPCLVLIDRATTVSRMDSRSPGRRKDVSTIPTPSLGAAQGRLPLTQVIHHHSNRQRPASRAAGPRRLRFLNASMTI